MVEYWPKEEKVAVCSLLIKVMDADEHRHNREIDLVKRIEERCGLNPAEIELAENLQLDDCKRVIRDFPEDKLYELKGLLIKMAYADGFFVDKEKAFLESLLGVSHYELELIAFWRDKEQVVVGCYSKKGNREYRFEDIRSHSFSELTYKNKEEIIIPIKKFEGLSENTYYEFSWTVELDDSKRGFHIVPKDNKFRVVEPKTLVDSLYANWENADTEQLRDLSNIQRMVNTQLTASSDGTFIYELLQNANDYPVKNGNQIEPVDVEFFITNDYLIYRHTGREFSPRNIAAISKLAAGEKKKEKNAIGYKGIGFKTVFSENDYVYLKTGDYSLRFDESITEQSIYFPWQVMPIWTNPDDVDAEVMDIIGKQSNFRVQMAIRPREKSKLKEYETSYEFIFNDIFKDEKDILFIPNIRSVTVYYDGKEQIFRQKDVKKWALTEKPLLYTFSQEEIDENNREVDTNKRIPEKYRDFEDTSISFSCQRDGKELLPVDDAKIYCYLPTQVSFGFPFLMNTDMIPTGPRDDIEKKVKFNHKIMKIAGGKFVEWISSLIKCGEYDISSVFSILPDLDNKVENYEDFIDEFSEGFDEALETIKLVPTNADDYELISHIAYDKTGLSSAGIMSDGEFLKFTGLEGYCLPHSELRNCRKFKSFLNRYAEDEQVFDEDQLTDLIANEYFQEWLKVQENNNKFLKFLLENDYLQNLLEEEIFLEDEGSLFTATELYYDVDKYLTDLQAFTDNIYFLSPKTRLFFKNNEEWESVIDDAFAQFDCDDFVDSVLLSKDNKDTTIKRLKDKDTSIHFYKFLSENVGYCDKYLELPFFNDSNDVVDGFNDKFIFASSKRGHDICDKEWLSGVTIEFISSDYDHKTKEYFKENFGVEDFIDKYLVENVILNDDYQGNISDAINDNFEISKDFLLYCFSQKELFNTKSLGDISLKVFDGDGEEQWYIADGDVFFPSSNFDYYSKKTWIDASWMVVLDETYFDGVNNTTELKKFIADSFGVEELVDKNFYENIVKQHLDEIYKNISADNDEDGTKNIDFVRYLDDNYQLIFEQKKDYDKFDKLILVSSETSDVDKSEDNLYIFDSELNDIISHGWFPDDLVKLCHPDYGQSNALKRIGVKSYSFKDFYDDVIIGELDSINKYINSKEKSITFHNFVIDHLSQLTDEQKAKMKGAKVYLYGQNVPASTAHGHNMLSKSAKELMNLGLVEFSDLDIIDPDYEPEKNSRYWESSLENVKFTTKRFINWIKDNRSSFVRTIQDKALNISFWRWMMTNVNESSIEEVPILPVLLKSGNMEFVDKPIFFSDEYLDGVGIEKSVCKYNANALFLSPDYLCEEDNLPKWKSFWINVGIKYDIIDILVETVIPRLTEIDDENLPRLLADNREALEKRFENRLAYKLSDLRVKAQDGEFYAVSKAIYIDCEKEEPFPYVPIQNQISFESAEERRLIKDIFSCIGKSVVDRLAIWRQKKLDSYMEMQQSGFEKIKDIHYQLVNDLAAIRNSDKESFRTLNRVEEIMFYNKDGNMRKAPNLTMGSKYEPFFDFEYCGVESLEYISDTYTTKCKETVKNMFSSLHVHCDFKKSDIDCLKLRECALYFWNDYVNKDSSKRNRELEDIFSRNLLNNVACIPTMDSMMRPFELYYGKEVNKFRDFIENGANKFPLQDLVGKTWEQRNQLFDKLRFKNELSLTDALSALPKALGKEKRVQLVEWIIHDFNYSKKYLIDKYLDNEKSVWQNVNRDDFPIKSLYALAPNDNKLSSYFGANQFIINSEYLPKGELFKKACEIFRITIISPEDIIMRPDGVSVYNEGLAERKLYALIISALIADANWKETYESYCSKLNDLKIHKCQSIKVVYEKNEKINKTVLRFYYKSGSNDFYFVNSLDNKRVFSHYVRGLMEYLEINNKSISFDLVEEIMDGLDSALSFVTERNPLISDEEFKSEIKKLISYTKFNKYFEKREQGGPVSPKDDNPKAGYTPEKQEEIPSNTPSYSDLDEKKLSKAPEEDMGLDIQINRDNGGVVIKKGEDSPITKAEQYEAQLEAQRFLTQKMPDWKFPEGYGKKNDDGVPFYFSTITAKDAVGNDIKLVLKSYKQQGESFKINTEEWDSMIKQDAHLFIYDGEKIVEIKPKELIMNQSRMSISFSTENLDIEDRINAFAETLHYFKDLHFDFESFNIAKRAKSIQAIYNITTGKQIPTNDDDL